MARSHDSYAPGAFGWAGLATSDPVGARVFYEHLFEWQSEELSAGAMGRYTALRRDGSQVAIVYRQTREARVARAAPHWTPFVFVEDTEATARQALALGGTLLRAPFDVSGGDGTLSGKAAAVADPAGAIVSLWQPRSDHSEHSGGDVGSLCWHELRTPDTDGAKAFYSALLGWTYEGDARGHSIVQAAGSAVASIRESTERSPAVAAAWIPHFRVEWVEDVMRRAEQQGGRALNAPTAGPRGRSALVADPQGAVFAVVSVTDGRFALS